MWYNYDKLFGTGEKYAELLTKVRKKITKRELDFDVNHIVSKTQKNI